MQTAIAFPQSLTEKYRPHVLAEFAGLDKQKRILSKFAAHPYPSAWLFVGPPGVGKTVMALAMAEEIKAEHFTISLVGNATLPPCRTFAAAVGTSPWVVDSTLY